jgi:hypothetical protein
MCRASRGQKIIGGKKLLLDGRRIQTVLHCVTRGFLVFGRTKDLPCVALQGTIIGGKK